MEIIGLEKHHLLSFSPEQASWRLEAVAVTKDGEVIKISDGRIIRKSDGYYVGQFSYATDGQLSIWVNTTALPSSTEVINVMQDLQSFIYTAMNNNQY